jgi:hypothetical protein
VWCGENRPAFRRNTSPLTFRVESYKSSKRRAVGSLLNIGVVYGLVVRVLAYRSGGPGSIPGTTRKKSSESGTGSTQLREYN